MRYHAWLLVSIVTFIGPSVNSVMNKQAASELGGGFTFSLENSQHFAFNPKPMSLSESRITLSDSTVSESAFSEPAFSESAYSKSAYSESAYSESGYSESAYSESAFSESAFSEATTESTMFPFELTHSESSTSPETRLKQFTDNVTHTVTRSSVNPVNSLSNENRPEEFDNSSFTHSNVNSSKNISLTNATSSEADSKFDFTSECACGDGETFSQRRRDEERRRNEERHKQEVFREMNRNGGFESRLNSSKEVDGGGKEQKNNGRHDLSGNLKEMQLGKKEKEEDRIVNGFDVSGLARPWHASLVMKTKQ